MTRVWAVIATAALAVSTAAVQPVVAQPLPSESFLYQRRNVDLAAVATSGYRVVVLDASRDGTPAGIWTPQEIADLRAAGKVVLALVRVGEADATQAYWDPAWVNPETPELAPAWLGDADEERPGIYRVRYWDPAWQALVFGSTTSLVDGAIAQGFDGVVLQAVNAFEYWGPDGKLPSSERNPNANTDMVNLVSGLAFHARTLSANPDFHLVPENGAALAADDTYVSTVSGMIAESTWFVAERRQKSRFTRLVMPYLDRILEVGKPVFSLEYPTTEKTIDLMYDRAESKGFVPLATTPAHDVQPALARHPAGMGVPFVPQSPLPNADAYPNQPLSFSWSSSGQDGLTYRIRFSGSESRQWVFSFPKTRTLDMTAYTPTAWEWRSILRLARQNNAGRVYWWITTQDSTGALRSSPARIFYRMHSDVPTTIFWIGAEAGQTSPKSRATSAWDADWVAHFGGVDDPMQRGDPDHPFWPPFTPLENPFYVALPYNDFTDSGVRRPNFANVVPWARFREYGPLESAVKNRWVKVTYEGNACYAQWQDAGPFQTYDFRYVFGTSKARNKENFGSGLEASPALRDCLDLPSFSATAWRFVFDDEAVPDGPWAEIVTTSQITLPTPTATPTSGS